ncbi:MAG: chitobiase/beta-hexosaminidase C-terminal domain-containing protein [Spirochaetales bacterium]|nr:chitobiase/beta-hexosaminidase C-terminal domain-containing protein [Spirochaetales bacterium]
MKMNKYSVLILPILLCSCANAESILSKSNLHIQSIPQYIQPISALSTTPAGTDKVIFNTVETPILSVPAGDFWNTITVFVFSDTKDATIYYTTNGADPTSASTLYTDSGIKIDNTTTLKVVATKSGLENSPIVAADYVKQGSQTYTENKSGVMLQGFNWDSAPRDSAYNAENPSPKWYKWYDVMHSNANAIKNTFEYVWFPPPSKTDTASSEGYAPTQLNDLNNCYGTEEELKSVIQAIKPAKAIADIVINHRAGTASWGDFTNPRWTDDYYSICSNDDFFKAGNPGEHSEKRGNSRIGVLYPAYRNIDHTNIAVQQGIYSWMNSVLKRAGFVGWRYDFVKGFGGEYVGYYNAMSEAAFSVGEYWPSSSDDWHSTLANWINATSDSINSVNGKKSRAFDFVLKQNLNHAFGWYKVGENHKDLWDLSLLADEKSLMRSDPASAVTFVDNHDTGSTQQHWELSWSDIPVAYAFILTHPGFPCVAWQHYFTGDGWQYRGGETVPGTGNTFKKHIDYLIDLRKSLGIEYASTVNVLSSSTTLYVAKIIGTKGEIVVAIGGDAYTPTGDGYTGNYPIYQGINFKIWQKGNHGAKPIFVNIAVDFNSADWIWNNNAVIFAWVWGGLYGSGQWVKANVGSDNTANFTIYNDAAAFLVARCAAGTDAPNWDEKGNGIGRIYNKSNNIYFEKEKKSYRIDTFDF